MAEINENPYQSPRSLAAGAQGFALRDGSYRRTVKGAAWAGATVGSSLGAALGVATDLAIVVIVLYCARVEMRHLAPTGLAPVEPKMVC